MAKKRKGTYKANAAYAAAMAGTDYDLDRDLESAALEHLVKIDRPR
jgi:hypothetical protein